MEYESLLHNPPHWNYFLRLERELEETFEFVAPVPAHFEVYSPAFARIILIAATETENALCGLAEALGRASKRPTIKDHFRTVSSRYPRFAVLEFEIPRYGMRIQPWKDWSEQAEPDWWAKGYNKIKHDRIRFPAAPTLLRAVEAVAGLQHVLLYLYRARQPRCALAGDRSDGLILPVEAPNPLSSSSAWFYELPDDEPYSPPPL